VDPNEALSQAPRVAGTDDIAAFQHTSESAGLAALVAERDLVGVVSLRVLEVRLGMEATCTLHCEEADPDTHEPGGRGDQEEGFGRAADHLDTAAEGSSPVPEVDVVADRAFAGDQVLELRPLTGSDVVGNKVLAVVGIVRVVACSEVDHGAYLGNQGEAQGVATASCQVVEVAPVSEKQKLCLRHWECADY
jgi:hypothetical protein